MKKFIYLLLFFIPASSMANISSMVELISEGIYTATDLENWSEQVKSSKSAQTLCEKLSPLKDDELIYFETLFTRPQSVCEKQVHQRLKKINQQQSLQHFNTYFSSLSRTKGFKHLRNLRPAPQIPDRPDLGLVNTALGPVFITGDLPAGYVALTFDDGPHPRLTPEILDILKRYSVRATFFPVGRNVSRRPHIVQDLAREGHSYGSHTQTHPNLANLSFRKSVQEIEEGLDAITKVTGIEMRFFRFPYGSTTSRLKRYLKDEGYASFFWNIDSLDWKHRDSSLIYNEVVALLNQKRRGIMLFHDIVGATPSAVETLLLELTRKGYKIVHFRPQ